MDLLDHGDFENGESPQILIYGIDEAGLDLLTDYMLNFDVQSVIALDDFLLDSTIGEIIEGEGRLGSEVGSIDGKFILFYDCADGNVDQFIRDFGQLGMARPIFGIINEENIDWSAAELLEALLFEHENREEYEDEELAEEEETDSFEHAYGFNIETEESEKYQD